MDLLRIAGATVNQTPMDWDGNRKRIATLIIKAREHEVDVLCFPELCISGYNCEDMFLSMDTLRLAESTLASLLPETRGMTVVLGLPVFHQGFVYNCAVVIQDGAILGVSPKKVLPKEGVHYESRWFQPGRFGCAEKILLAGANVPFGDFRYQFGTFAMAVEICEEAWRSRATAGAHADHGVELIVIPSASHFALGKVSVRETLVANNSRSMQVHYLYTNLLGLESGRTLYDGGVIIAECGKITTRGRRFGFHDGDITMRDVDLDLARTGKLRNRAERIDEDVDAMKSLVVTGKDQMRLNKRKKKPIVPLTKIHDEAKENVWVLNAEEEFLAAQMMGLFDYMRKTKSRGYMVSLSGGCDSAVVAVLVAQMVSCALGELGAEEFARRLGVKVDQNQLPHDDKAWTRLLLTTIYQATQNSGEVTRCAAYDLAAALGADHHEAKIQDIVDAYVNTGSDMIGRKLTWQQDDIALQNIQARVRAPLAWLLANLKGAVLLATSNRSEVAVGYATMDGDTAGGLAPLGGIDKPFLRQWLKWMESDCSWGRGSLSVLSAINNQAPTAELRPSENSQKDEDDLMPYPILGRIEKMLVRDHMSPRDMLEALTQEFPGYGRADLTGYLQRFLRLFAQNQWKRERYAPAFHIDDESLDPKSWWRFPILSGGFVREMSSLDDDDDIHS